jgi:hypothetical protein
MKTRGLFAVRAAPSFRSIICYITVDKPRGGCYITGLLLPIVALTGQNHTMSLSNAERQARWQAKHKKEFERLKRVAERATAEPSADSKELIAARNEIARLRARVAELEKAKQVPEGAATAEEWAAAKRAATRTQPAPTKTPRKQ